MPSVGAAQVLVSMLFFDHPHTRGLEGMGAGLGWRADAQIRDM